MQPAGLQLLSPQGRQMRLHTYVCLAWPCNQGIIVRKNLALLNHRNTHCCCCKILCCRALRRLGNLTVPCSPAAVAAVVATTDFAAPAEGVLLGLLTQHYSFVVESRKRGAPCAGCFETPRPLRDLSVHAARDVDRLFAAVRA